MIFVCVGSRSHQFNRLLKKLDELVQTGRITDRIVAQIGSSEYEPQNYEWHRFLDQTVFKQYQQDADLIISHAGTGALVGALKLEKQVIAVPRLAKFGEHGDDHQLQIADVLASEGYLRQVIDIEDLGDVVQAAYDDPIIKKYDRPSNIVDIIDDFLTKNLL